MLFHDTLQEHLVHLQLYLSQMIYRLQNALYLFLRIFKSMIFLLLHLLFLS